MDPATCHITAGSSGDPKLRQLVTASGRAPVAATFRYASASASCAPAYGSSRQYRPFPSVAIATPRWDSSSILSTPASCGAASTVLPRTSLSYCSVTQVLSAPAGDPSTASRASRRPAASASGLAALAGSPPPSVSSPAGRLPRPPHTGPFAARPRVRPT